MLTSVIGVVVLLGGLIFFHEFGHYTVAKLFGVKVEIFSLGFGKRIFAKKIGETEYCLSLFPLGGYVKLMGDDPYKGVPAAEADRAFSTQKLYKRFAIVAAGPLANLLLAYILFVVVFWVGKPMVGTEIGLVTANSPAWEAGLRPKDRITQVNGEKVVSWQELDGLLRNREGQKLDVKVQRGQQELSIPLTVNKVRAKNAFGEDEEVGGIKGISPAPLASLLGVSNPNSLAAKAGLKTGDLVTKINDTNVSLYEDISSTLREGWQPGKPLSLSVKREEEGKEVEKTFTLNLPAKPTNVSVFGPQEALGIFPTEVFVGKVSPDSPGERAGLKDGDRIVKLNGTPIYNFDTIVDKVQELGRKGEQINLELERNGKAVSMALKAMETTQEDPLTHQPYTKFLVGFQSQTGLREPDYITFSIREPLKLFSHAAHETYDLADKMVVSLVKLATGSISVKNLGGPVLIASVAGKSLDAGIVPFLQMMALISINLFLLNLFPIPILDGGHLLFFFIEGIKGKPVSVRTMEIANQVGMVFIMMLVGLTLFNDISRIVKH